MITVDVEYRVRPNGDRIVIIPAAQFEVMFKEVERLEGLLEARQVHTEGVMRLKEASDRAAGKAEEETVTYLNRLQTAHECLIGIRDLLESPERNRKLMFIEEVILASVKKVIGDA